MEILQYILEIALTLSAIIILRKKWNQLDIRKYFAYTTISLNLLAAFFFAVCYKEGSLEFADAFSASVLHIIVAHLVYMFYKTSIKRNE